MGVALMLLFSFYSCGPAAYMAVFSPEESGLNLMKITDEAANSVAGNGSTTSYYNYYVTTPTSRGISQNDKLTWSTARVLSVSPDGSELAYMSVVNNP